MGYIATGFYNDKEFLVFKGIQAIGLNSLSLLFAFVGTTFFMKKYGLKFCLVAFPATVGVVVSATLLLRTFGMGDYSLMWALLVATVIIKGLNYALNKPTGEIMYIPTSKDVKFKAKGWIDMFGNRSTKSIGATVSKSLCHSFSSLMVYGTLISLGFVGIWIFVAFFVGNSFQKLQDEKAIIE